MSHEHQHSGSKPQHQSHEAPASLQRHRNWMIAAIALMLLGMLAYVFSMDEAIEPEGPPGEEIPAAAE